MEDPRFAFHLVKDGQKQLSKYTDLGSEIIIGTAKGCFLRLKNSRGVIEHHASIQLEKQHAVMTLFGEVWINSHKFDSDSGKHRLTEGDHLIFGDLSNHLHIRFSDLQQHIPLSASSLNRQLTFNINFEEHAPGSLIGVWKGEENLFLGKYGHPNVLNSSKMDENMHFRVGSVTKTFTAALILQLVSEGKLSLDTEASTLLPQVPNGISILQLANMTAGLFNYSENDEFLEALDKDPQRIWKPEELLQIGLEGEIYFKPSLGWAYSNTNYIILGLIIEKLTGDTFENQLKKRIFDPLDMNDTSCDFKLKEPYSRGYMYGYHSESKKRPDLFRDVTDDNPSWTWAAGCVTSTMSDLKKFIKPFVLGELFKIEKSIFEKTFVYTRFCSYGVGHFRFETKKVWLKRKLKKQDERKEEDIDGYYGHNGNIPGFQCTMFYSPKKDHTIVVMTNLNQRKGGVTPADCLTREIIKTLNDFDS